MGRKLRPPDPQGAPEPEIEIMPEMIEAGRMQRMDTPLKAAKKMPPRKHSDEKKGQKASINKMQ